MTKLAIIAGAGGLPAALVAACPDRPLICALEGFAPAGLTPDQSFRVERLALFLRLLEDQGVTEVALHDLFQPVPVLDNDGLIEAHLFLKRFADHRVVHRFRAADRIDDIAGQRMDKEEDDNGEEQNNRYKLQQPVYRVDQHDLSFSSG